DRRRAELALHAGENRREPDELPIRVESQDRVDEGIAAVRQREALPQPLADLPCPDIAPGAVHVRVGRLDDLMLGPVLLVATELAAVVELRRLITLPFELVDRQRPAARDALRREHVVDREAQAGLAVWRGAEGGERSVEVAEIGRPKDDLGEEPGQRAGLEREAASLPVDGGAGDPAAAAVEVGHDVAGRR